jgi:hypothetical protein
MLRYRMPAYPFLSNPQLSSALIHDSTVRAIPAACDKLVALRDLDI